MKKITLIIEKAEDGGYGVYSKEISGVIGYGLTENEAKEDAKEILEEQAEFYREKHGAFPEWYSKNMQIEYRYDFSGFFLAFPFFNVSKFAEEIGINASLTKNEPSAVLKTKHFN